MGESEGYLFLKDIQSYITNKSDPNVLKFTKDDQLLLGSKKYSKFLKSEFTIGSSSSAEKEFYTVGSIIFFLQNQTTRRGTYFKEAKANKYQVVKQLDRKKLLSLLESKKTFENVGIKDAKSKAKNPDKYKKHALEKKTLKTAEDNEKLRLQHYWDRQEKPLATIDTILRVRKVNFGIILSEVLEKYQGEGYSSYPSQNRKVKKVKVEGKTAYPIIIVPATTTSVINLGNIQSFLEQGKWNQVKPNTSEVKIVREEATNGIREYRVISNINKLEKDDFKQVICIFVQGQRWQFKNWPSLGNNTHKDLDMASIFNSYLGVHVSFEGEKVNANVQQWNVKTFGIKRQTRNMDQIQSHRIWEEIDKFILNKKPELIP